VDTVLVTSGTGFIARWCIVGLLEQGFEVRTTVRSPARESDVRPALGEVIDADDRLTIVVGDLTSDDGWADAMTGCRYVLHPASLWAARHPRR
jgi:nucleoside-diphosphate-sugar epimerase